MEIGEDLMKKRSKFAETLSEYTIMTLATLIMAAGIYLFRFPNNFSFGGVTGIAVLLAAVFPVSASALTTVMNIALLVLGLFILGRGFGVRTIYVTVLLSGMLSLAERLFPMDAPLTNEPMLELIFAIILPSIASAVFFNMNASSGGTDILAMIITKYTRLNISTTLMLVDVIVALSAFVVFDVETGLYSLCGLLAKSLVIDSVIENINLCKVFTIICDRPEPITDYIMHRLNRGVTTYRATGGYKKEEKTVIITIMRRSQAIALRNYIRINEPGAFIAITNSSEIIGNGFHQPL